MTSEFVSLLPGRMLVLVSENKGPEKEGQEFSLHGSSLVT